MDCEKMLLVLGAGRHQVNLIKAAENRGVRTIVSDFYPDSPGKAFCSIPTMTDVMDIEANINLAKHHQVDGVITTGTDQALVTMATVAQALGLPCYLTPENATKCTNKELMSRALQEVGVKQARSKVANDRLEVIGDFSYPVIVKPSDSQGQRGISICSDPEDLSISLANALENSRSSTAVIEEFLTGPEVTVTAWVHGHENVDIFLITDRVTFNRQPAVGVAFQHVYPSSHCAQDHAQLRDITRKVATAYNLSNGPLYIQLIKFADQYYVVEATSRVGGGHEEALIKYTSGHDVNEYLIDLALGIQLPSPNFQFDPDSIEGVYWINFLLASEGIFAEFEFPKLCDNLLEGGFYQQKGYEQTRIVNGQSRSGYFIGKTKSASDFRQLAKDLYTKLHIRDMSGHDLLFWPHPVDLNMG